MVSICDGYRCFFPIKDLSDWHNTKKLLHYVQDKEIGECVSIFVCGWVWMCFQLFHHTDEAGPGQVGRFNCKLKMEHFRTFTIHSNQVLVAGKWLHYHFASHNHNLPQLTACNSRLESSFLSRWSDDKSIQSKKSVVGLNLTNHVSFFTNVTFWSVRHLFLGFCLLDHKNLILDSMFL